MNTDVHQASIGDLWKWLETVVDPEIPVLTILDMGIVRRIEIRDNDQLTISDFEGHTNTTVPVNPENAQVLVLITPTYTGCPAMNMIAAHIRLELAAHGFKDVTVREVLQPAWTTEWIPESARQKLREYGIAPPEQEARFERLLFSDVAVTCPRCQSRNTEKLAEYGSTACKALYRCKDCLEPFDYFKCH
jgi:ring-1,2-phenylacetyl-CoA epoxidase subunit PaaD